MKTIAIISVLFAVGCAVDPSTSSTTQNTVGICTDVPGVPGQDSVSCLYNQTVSYSQGIAVQNGYDDRFAYSCGGSQCVATLDIGGGHHLECVCDLGGSCASYDCPGNVASPLCTQID